MSSEPIVRKLPGEVAAKAKFDQEETTRKAHETAGRTHDCNSLNCLINTAGRLRRAATQEELTDHPNLAGKVTGDKI